MATGADAAASAADAATDTSNTSSNWPREGYRPEWLALEDASGGRYVMTGDLSIDVPTYDAVFASLAKQWPALPEELTVWDEKTDVEHGNLDVRIYQPASDKPLPLMIYFHGGGYIAGTLETEDAHCRIFAAKVPCLVISVNYPKAPGVKIDGIIDVAARSVPWCRARAQQLGHDPSKTLLCGGSAGAFLATQIVYRFICEGDTSSPSSTSLVTGCVLLFPVILHWEYRGKYKHMYTSWEDNGNSGVPVFGLELAKFIWSHYGIDFTNPRHFPLLAGDGDLSRFPPCYIVTAEKDCARDDGILLHHRLGECGVPSKLDHYDGLPHYFHVFPALGLAHEAMAKAVEGARFVLQA